MNIIRTAVIGTGYLGKYHVEKFATLPRSKLIAICDIDADHTHELCEKYSTTATNDYRTLVGKVDAVSVATPTPLHYEIAQFFLENHIHVLIEKPITANVEQADHLIQIAKKNNLILQVGHIERFNSAFKFMNPQLNNPLFIEAQRLTAFKLRGSDVSVILDMMIHDIDIILSLVDSPITASRINTNSERRLRVFQRDAYFNVDLQRHICRIRRKAKTEMFPGVPDIAFEEKYLDKGDALKDEIDDFLLSIIDKKPPAVSGQAARDALATAIQITNIITEKNEKYK